MAGAAHRADLAVRVLMLRLATALQREVFVRGVTRLWVRSHLAAPIVPLPYNIAKTRECRRGIRNATPAVCRTCAIQSETVLLASQAHSRLRNGQRNRVRVAAKVDQQE